MSREHRMRAQVCQLLAVLDAQPVENSAQQGTPDVNCTLGWIELKYLERWPRGADTPVRVDHFTPQQRLWLKRRKLANGGAWVLLRVEDDWLLLDGTWASDCLGYVHQSVLWQSALARWNGRTPTNVGLVGALLQSMNKERSLPA